MINILLAINSNQVDSFLNNWKFDTEGNRLAGDFAPFTSDEHTIDVYDNTYCVVPQTAQGFWKENSENKQLVSIYIANIPEPDWTDPQDPDPADILTVIHYLRETFSGSIQILGAWNKDGTQHGQFLIPAEYDAEGEEIIPESIIGTPTYSLSPTLDFMPDDVTYDSSGNETSRTSAINNKQVNLLAGWTNRRWT